MTGVFIFGESGRMGQEVKKIVEAHPKLQYLGGFDRKSPQDPKQVQADIIIDFSLPEATNTLIEFVQKHPCAVVSGTTGWTDEQKKAFQEMGTGAPVFWSANMSFGVYLMCQLTEVLARFEKFYTFKIEETHHIHKKDKPSGTALMIQKAAEKSVKEIKDVESIREGDVFGIHRFIGRSENELIEIRHEALNRGLFAQGAVDISLWLNQQPNGFYEMTDFFKGVSQ